MNVVPGGEAHGTAAAALKRLHWDIALSFSAPVLNMLKDVVGLDHKLFGTDFPYLRRDIGVRSAREIRETTALSASERQALLHGNAQQLFPRLCARLGAVANS